MTARPVPDGASAQGEAYRRDIDGLRAFAVLAVVVFHAFPDALPGGYVGVDVFFVISGYLITGVLCAALARETFSFADFYARRIRRIVPALLVVLAACYAFGWIALLPDEFRQLGKHIAAGIGFVSNFALWSEAGYFDASASAKPLLHLWSLGIEEQFYLVWPVALWWFWRMRRNALWLVAAIGVVSFAINLATVRSAPVATFYSPLSRFWELQLGCLLALLLRRWEAQPKSLPRGFANACSIAGAVALALSIAFFSTRLAFPGAWALLPTVGTFLMIAAGPDAWLNRHVLSQRIAVGIGLISYPLYLWHWPILSFASIVESGTPSASMRVACVLAGVVLAFATYVLIEKPIRFGANRRIKVAALAVSSIAAALAGGIAFLRSGLPSRFPPEVQAIANFQYEYKTDARYPDCWLSATQPFDGFAPFCLDTSAGGPVTVLWGDSHAARFYPGLKSVTGGNGPLVQFTRDACPPMLGVGLPNCQKSNAWIVEQIARIRPATTILFAAWMQYPVPWSDSAASKAPLLLMIDELRKAGISNIVVVGPAPFWKGGLPKLMYQAWRDARPFHVFPDRLATGLVDDAFKVDREMRAALAEKNVRYASTIDAFCTDATCMTHTADGVAHLVTWDSSHLTTDGATFLAQRFASDGVFR